MIFESFHRLQNCVTIFDNRITTLQFAYYNWILITSVVIEGALSRFLGEILKEQVLILDLPQLGYLFNPTLDFHLRGSLITVPTTSSRPSIEMAAFITYVLLRCHTTSFNIYGSNLVCTPLAPSKYDLGIRFLSHTLCRNCVTLVVSRKLALAFG